MSTAIIEAKNLFSKFDIDGDVGICCEEFEKCYREVGPIALATPSEEEIYLIKAIQTQLFTLSEEASKSGTCLFIDAEQTEFQLFCYLKDAPDRIKTDLERSECQSYHFATNLVQGACMMSEPARAKEMSYPSPVCDTALHFAQLYGMTDNLTYTLDCMPYLMRRAQENSDMLENSSKEIFMKKVDIQEIVVEIVLHEDAMFEEKKRGKSRNRKIV
eukprot:14444073-Ditylum_brightwellii.AAC.1